ncbi:MAG: protein-export chaperone SecB [Pseudomonadota bacterium]
MALQLTGDAEHASSDIDTAGAPSIVSQHIKSITFDSPDMGRAIDDSTEQPELNVQVNVEGRADGRGRFESIIQVDATAEDAKGVVYTLSVQYAGLVAWENAPEDKLEKLLISTLPRFMFPYLRRLVSDVTREGGFPPLLLDPIDFDDVYAQRKAAQQQAAA